MTDTMLERMARAICDSSSYDATHWRDWLPQARAALEAIRDAEITDKMRDGYIAAIRATDSASFLREPAEYHINDDGFRGLINAILSEGQSNG